MDSSSLHSHNPAINNFDRIHSKKFLDRTDREPVKGSGFTTAHLARNLSLDPRFKKLPIGQRHTLLYAALHFADKEGKFWTTVKTAGNEAGTSHKTAKRALAAAIEVGLIVKREPHAGPTGQQGSSTYWFDPSLVWGQNDPTVELKPLEGENQKKAGALDDTSPAVLPAQHPSSLLPNREDETLWVGSNWAHTPEAEVVMGVGSESTYPSLDDHPNPLPSPRKQLSLREWVIEKLAASGDWNDGARAGALQAGAEVQDEDTSRACLLANHAGIPMVQWPKEAVELNDVAERADRERLKRLYGSHKPSVYSADELITQANSLESRLGWDDRETKAAITVALRHIESHKVFDAIRKSQRNLTTGRRDGPKHLLRLVAGDSDRLHQKLLADLAPLESGAA